MSNITSEQEDRILQLWYNNVEQALKTNLKLLKSGVTGDRLGAIDFVIRAATALESL